MACLDRFQAKLSLRDWAGSLRELALVALRNPGSLEGIFSLIESSSSTESKTLDELCALLEPLLATRQETSEAKAGLHFVKDDDLIGCDFDLVVDLRDASTTLDIAQHCNIELWSVDENALSANQASDLHLHAPDQSSFAKRYIEKLTQQSPEQSTGQGRHWLSVNTFLARSLRRRAMRYRKGPWTREDGFSKACKSAMQELAAHQLGARSFSPTALQHYAACPYRFFSMHCKPSDREWLLKRAATSILWSAAV
ncbi:MAG: hypothetical protein IPJ88_07700 [Myxococcales bacterium]|nr:MAG: hypothetical protein IPJ88_07700 [Myxococcales bacterium]